MNVNNLHALTEELKGPIKQAYIIDWAKDSDAQKDHKVNLITHEAFRSAAEEIQKRRHKIVFGIACSTLATMGFLSIYASSLPVALSLSLLLLGTPAAKAAMIYGGKLICDTHRRMYEQVIDGAINPLAEGDKAVFNAAWNKIADKIYFERGVYITRKPIHSTIRETLLSNLIKAKQRGTALLRIS